MRTIKRVSVGSAFKVGAVLTGLIYAIFGAIGLLCGGALTSMMAGLSSSLTSTSGVNGLPNSSALALGGGGLVGGIIFYVIAVVVAMIFGGIFGAIYAFLYNVTVGMTGGLEIEMD